MAGRTLFGHVALRLAHRPEDYAVEALNYILGQSEAARIAVIAQLMPWNAQQPELRFRSQVVGENSRPDIVGFAPDGTEMLILEAKFWAGLTEAQPLEYIRRLSSDNGSTLSFIVPDARIESLWRELVGRILGEHPAAQIIESAGSTIKALKIDSARYVSITSWSSLTETVLGVLDRNDDFELFGDVVQLAGLCIAMDDDAFLPLQGHETGPEVPRRILQLYGLVERVVQHAETEGLAKTTGMQAVAAYDGWGRYFQFGDSDVWLGVKFSFWASEADTPIWFRFQDSSLGRFREVSKAYSGWEIEQRPRLIYDERNIPSFPIYLEYGMERDQLVEAIVGQIKSICAPLKRSPGHTLG